MTTTQLSKLHVLQFLTYQPSSQPEIDHWLGRLGTKDLEKPPRFRFAAPCQGQGVAQVNQAHGVLLVLRQYQWEPAAGFEETVSRIKNTLAYSKETGEGNHAETAANEPPPQWMGETTVIMAAEEGDHADTANTLFATLRPGRKEALRGGAIADGIELFLDDACELVVVLARPEAEAEAAKRVYHPLRNFLTFVHKTQAQQKEYKLIGDEIKELPSSLRQESERMVQQVRDLASALENEQPPPLQQALAQRLCLMEAYRPFREKEGLARGMRTSLVTNRHNLRDLLKDVGQGPGVAALERQVDRVGRNIAQIETDMDYAQPYVEEVDRIAQDHQNSVLTALSLFESRANVQRETKKREWDRRNFLIGLLAFWLGLAHIWVSAVGVAYEARTWGEFWSRLAAAGGLMLTPAVIVLVSVYWLWTHPAKGHRSDLDPRSRDSSDG
ncbi:MAG TPA: hypothetical protein VJY33_24100 [Isosphaeraceae bacterium]|nr:hypothetical protein [Isosphaeraceae bacterium]